MKKSEKDQYFWGIKKMAVSWAMGHKISFMQEPSSIKSKTKKKKINK